MSCIDAPHCDCCNEDASVHDSDLMTALYAEPVEERQETDAADQDATAHAAAVAAEGGNYVAALTVTEDWELSGSDWEDRLYPD